MNTLTTSFKFSSSDFTNQFAVPHPPCSTGHAPPHFALKTLHKVLAPHGGNSPFKLCSVNSASLSLLPFLSFPSLRYHFFSIRAVFTPLFAGCRTPWASTSCSTFGSLQWEYCSIIFPERSQTFLSARLPSSASSTFPSCNPGRQLFGEPAAGFLIPKEPPGALTHTAGNPQSFPTALALPISYE